jgi:hypothetical protein
VFSRADVSSRHALPAVVRNKLRTLSEFTHVACYAALPYLADFKAGQAFG